MYVALRSSLLVRAISFRSCTVTARVGFQRPHFVAQLHSLGSMSNLEAAAKRVKMDSQGESHALRCSQWGKIVHWAAQRGGVRGVYWRSRVARAMKPASALKR